jgi:ketosteroid isomerase-like protein
VSNLDLAARFNRAAEDRDKSQFGDLITEDAVWDMSRSRGPYSGIYQGHDEIRQLLEGVIEVWASMRFKRLSTYEVGDILAEEVEVTMKGEGSGVEVVGRGARVYEFRDGRIARFTMFQGMDDARAFVDAQP